MNNPFDNSNNEYRNENDNQIPNQEPKDQAYAQNREQVNNATENPFFNNQGSNNDNYRGYSYNNYGYNNPTMYGQNSNNQFPPREQYQYGAQPQYNRGYANNGYYGGGYYSPNQANSQYSQPYMNEKKKPKPVSHGFVVTAVCISIAISFFLGIFTSAFVSGILADPEIYTNIGNGSGGDKVVIQHVQKNEEQPVVSDKGIAAYVTSLVADTVVEVRTEKVATDSIYGQYITQGAGSGVIISSTENGSHIITCAHVIEGATRVTVKLKDGTTYEADSIIYDSETDVGVIKLNVKGLPTATFGDFSDVVVGEDVVLIGNPLGTLGGSVSSGIISALDRDILIDGTIYHLLQTNAHINPGNSGGGLFNAKGELIGIANAKSSGDNIEGIGFAIPIDDAQAIMTDLLEKGYVSGRVDHGLQLIDVQTQDDIRTYWKYSRYFTDYGVYIINSVNTDLREGDRIVAIGADPISSIKDINALMQTYSVGDTITLTISRVTNGNKVQLYNVEITLTEKKP